jgi:cytochrome c oxidase subunit 3
MSATSKDAASGGHHPWYLAHHYDDIKVQNHAVRLGMWLFLGTEVLLFAGLFLGYTVYRWLYHDAFKLHSQHLDLTLGTVNTVVLITSSFTVAWAYHCVKVDQIKKAKALLTFTIACACAFLVIKYFEYAHKFHEGMLPGRHYAFKELPESQLPGSNIFYAVYFLATGLHAFHVIVGMSVLGWVLWRIGKGKYNSEYYVPVELGALYWHLVDLVWIFLFPLLYLI